MNNPNTYSTHHALHHYALKLTCNNQHLASQLLAATISHITNTSIAYPAGTISFNTWAKIVMHSTFQQSIPNADKRELYYLSHCGTLNPIATNNHNAPTLKEQIHTLSRMTPQQATAVTLRLQGYTPALIAKQMGITTAQVKNHLTQARNTLNHAWNN